MTGRHTAEPRPLTLGTRLWRAAGIVATLDLALAAWLLR